MLFVLNTCLKCSSVFPTLLSVQMFTTVVQWSNNKELVIQCNIPECPHVPVHKRDIPICVHPRNLLGCAVYHVVCNREIEDRVKSSRSKETTDDTIGVDVRSISTITTHTIELSASQNSILSVFRNGPSTMLSKRSHFEKSSEMISNPDLYRTFRDLQLIALICPDLQGYRLNDRIQILKLI